MLFYGLPDLDIPKAKAEHLISDVRLLFGMPPVGVEPTLPCENWILSPARLPIPPQRQLLGM